MKNTNEYNNGKRKVSIQICIMLILVVAIVILIAFSFNIYAVDSNEDEVLLSDTNIENNNTSEEFIIITENKAQNITEESIDNNTENENTIVEETEEPEEDSSNTQANSKKTTTYTTDSGETYSIIATLDIPSLNINYPILSSTSTELLKISLNKYWGADPNEVGNMVVLGHNYKNSKFFGKLPNIKIGAVVNITDTSGRTLKYKVYDTDIIDPDDNECTSQLTDGHTEITLITCYYEKGKAHATKRFVVKARAN